MKHNLSQVFKSFTLIVFILAGPVFGDQALAEQHLTKTEKTTLKLKKEVPLQSRHELSSTLENHTNIYSVPMNLAKLIQIALKKNPGLQAARKGIKVSDQGILVAKGEQFGRIDFDVSDFTYGPDNLSLVMKSLVVDQRKIIADGTGVHNSNLFSLGGRFTIPIYTGGRITNQIELEKIGKKLIGNRILQTRDELIFNVASVYYSILKIQNFIQATQKSKDKLSESKRVIQQRFNEGKVAKVDILKVNTRLAAVEQLLIKFLYAQEILYGLLGTLLGEEAGKTKVAILGDLSLSSKQLTPIYTLHEVQHQALQRRPELLAMKNELKMQEKKIRIRFAEHLPEINLRGSVQGLAGDNSDPFAQVFAGIFLKVPIFAGGTIEAKVTQERVRYAKLQKEYIQLKLNVTQEVHEAYLKTSETRQRITAAQTAVDESNEVLRIEALKVREGKSIIENLLDAQTAQLQAEQNFSAAVADYQIQLMALKKAIGMIEVEG